MRILDYSSRICKELDTVLSLLDETEATILARRILSADRVFVAGMGRSGNMMKSFAMRLMHLNKICYVVGETTTPAIKKNDMLLIGSGSGKTKSLIGIAENAKECGAQLGLITIDPTSTISNLADSVVRIQASTPKTNHKVYTHSIQPLASLFEQGLLILLDAIVLWIMEQKNMDSENMFLSHANLE